MSDLLERRLASLSTQLDVDARDVVDEVMARLAMDADGRASTSVRPPRRRMTLALAAAALIAVAVLSIVVLPGPRHAVARWFGIGSTRIERTPITEPTAQSSAATASPSSSPGTASTSTASAITVPVVTFPTELDLGPPMSASAASAATGVPVPVAAELGPPTGIYVSHPPISGQVVVVYPPSARLPVTPVAGIGALLSAVPGTLGSGSFQKTTATGTLVEPLQFATADGETVDAIWLSGEPHLYSFVDADGQEEYDSLRLATNTLLWERNNVTYRLEADVSRDEAIEIASNVTIS